MEIKKGDVFIVDLKETYPCIQTGLRPCVIVSNSRANYYSSILTVIPVTSRMKKPLPTHVRLNNPNLQEGSIALAEQILTIGQSCLVKYICSLDLKTLNEIDVAINVQLDKKNTIIFDINKASTMLKVIKELENFIIRYSSQINDLTEIKNSLDLHIAELKDYCSKCGVDYRKFYKDSKEREMGEHVV